MPPADAAGHGLESFEYHNGRFNLPVEFDADDHCTPVPITQFDFSTFDTLIAEAKESLAAGHFESFVEGLRLSIENEVQLATITQIVGCASLFENPYMGFDLLRDSCGLSDLEGETGVSLAKKWGKSKEAWQQNREKLRQHLSLRKTRTMRDERARENMRLRNYRRA